MRARTALRRGAPRVAALAAACALALATAPRAGLGYVDGPPPAHTGGFGEPTCDTCHSGAAVDSGGVALQVIAPSTFTPGAEHGIEVRLVQPGMRRAGFQLSARFAGGALAGRQAGELVAAGPPEPPVRVVAAHAVSYAGHTLASAEPIDGGTARWRLRWHAPAGAAVSAVVFHAAANAADYDDSELGDRVYVASATSRPSRSALR
jgi:hypothetical protein